MGLLCLSHLRALVHVARTVNAQLVVLAARHGLTRVLGTVSQYVLRNAPCPVLTVPEAEAESRGLARGVLAPPPAGPAADDGGGEAGDGAKAEGVPRAGHVGQRADDR